MSTDNFEPFLCIGTTLATFRFWGKVPNSKEQLINIAIGMDTWLHILLSITFGKLLGPIDLIKLNDEISVDTSLGSVGV